MKCVNYLNLSVIVFSSFSISAVGPHILKIHLEPGFSIMFLLYDDLNVLTR